MNEPARSKKTKFTAESPIVKAAAYAAAVLLLAGIIWFSAYRLSTVFSSGFSADVFVYPLLMLKKMILSTLVIAGIICALVFYAVKHKKLWYLIPVGILFLSFYWYSINASVYKAFVKRYGTNQEK
jgi:hypothetical protein